MAERLDTCTYCRFFKAFPPSKWGECRRHSPERADKGNGVRRWPELECTEWCGDFEAKRGQS